MIGFGLPLGFGTGTDALTVWLGVGVSVLDEGWLAWCPGAADEIGRASCRERVFSSV